MTTYYGSVVPSGYAVCKSPKCSKLPGAYGLVLYRRGRYSEHRLIHHDRCGNRRGTLVCRLPQGHGVRHANGPYEWGGYGRG